MTSKVYPFASGSEYTASYAISSSVAVSASSVNYVVTASLAGSVLTPVSGSPAAVDICVITYQQYQQIASGSAVEQC